MYGLFTYIWSMFLVNLGWKYHTWIQKVLVEVWELVPWLAGASRDEQMSEGWPFSLLDDEQMSNWLGVEHQQVTLKEFSQSCGCFDMFWWMQMCWTKDWGLVGWRWRPGRWWLGWRWLGWWWWWWWWWPGWWSSWSGWRWWLGWRRWQSLGLHYLHQLESQLFDTLHPDKYCFVFYIPTSRIIASCRCVEKITS